MVPTSGQSINVPKYHVRIDIPIATNVQLEGGGQYRSAYLQGKNMGVFQLPFQPSNYDVLLGMDFISLFHITLLAGDSYQVTEFSNPNPVSDNHFRVGGLTCSSKRGTSPGVTYRHKAIGVTSLPIKMSCVT